MTDPEPMAATTTKPTERRARRFATARVVRHEFARWRSNPAVLVSVALLFLLGVVTGLVLVRMLPAERLPERLKKIATRIREALDEDPVRVVLHRAAKLRE